MPSHKSYKTLPTEPGCYLFKDKEGTVLYVGKAKNIKKRVASYFTKKDHDPKTQLLVKHIHTIDFVITKNEIEALLLENNLIKKYYPRYNLDLKDSRRYAYLHLTETEFPYLQVARTREEPGQYFGPFTSGKFRKEITNVLARHFKILTQKPSKLKLNSLNKEEYKKRLKQAISILKGNVNQVIKNLKQQMTQAAQNKNYEYAITLRNQIEALKYLREKQNVELRRNYDADIINYQITGERVYLLLFSVYQGILENKQEFEFDSTEEFLEEFLLQYYTNHPVPKEIILPKKIEVSLENFLSQARGANCEITVPQKGTKKALLDLAEKNVEIAIKGENTKVYELQKALNLNEPPNLIECFDISHLRGKDTVASMVVFKGGKPLKASYRKFRIRADTGGDDFAAMREVIHRRYAKSLKETMQDPDLIVIDGGAGQLSSALKILNELGLKIPIISLAKRLEEIYIPNHKKTLLLTPKNPALLLLRALRDEAHRFAITYNRSLRKRRIR